jgi:type 1 glutamine amidotransferase
MRRVAIAVGALALFSLAAAQAQQTTPGPGSAPASPPAGAQAPRRGGGGGNGLNEACGGRSQTPTVACANHVNNMMATLGLVPNEPPARPAQPRKVLIWSRIPSSGYQHSSIPLAAKLIEELGRKTGAWTSDTAWDLSAITAENLAQYDAIFLSSTTGAFLDDPDLAATEARRKALLDFIRNGKGIAGVHATGDSYHGRGGRRAAAPAAVPAAGAASGGVQGMIDSGLITNRGTPPAARGGGRGPGPCNHSNDGPGGGGIATWPEWISIVGGYFKYHWNYPTPITVKLDDPGNPINAAFKGKSFNTIDEVYTFNGWSRDNVHVLMSIDYNLMNDCDKGVENYPRTDGDYALAWIRPEGRGRLFYQALGHHESLYWNNPAFLSHILAGMQYAIGDLKADDSIRRRN